MGIKIVCFSKSIGMLDPIGAEIKTILEAFQPHTVPSALRVMRPEPSLEPHSLTPDLERDDQIHDPRTRLG
ncbi:hypothetical protein V6N11_078455 [Hibiscus sabdariffa]|uniref:Uncharacterized protein n=1 Tax=Hibiscus sabdariffa TaxID=183260 RepID=A0ABR2TGR4_9ROSI